MMPPPPPPSQSPGRNVDLTTTLWPTESRQLLAFLGSLGFLEMAFLSYQKLVVQDMTSLCTAVAGLSMRCGDVLNSEYAEFLGVPLTLPAMFAYGSVAFLAARPLFIGSEQERERAEADLATRAPLLLLTTAMATFSTYLMWLLATQLQELCPYCLASATLSFSMAALTWSKRIVPDATKSAIYKGSTILVTGLFSVGAYAYATARIIAFGDGLAGLGGTDIARSGTSTSRMNVNAPPKITTHSDERSLRLAARLEGMGAKMYGAFWCSHCYEQKQTLGKEAFAKIAYLECAPDGLNSQSKACKARKVPGYPTWEINGGLYPGEKSVEQLEAIVDGKVPVPPPLIPEAVRSAAATVGEGGGSSTTIL